MYCPHCGKPLEITNLNACRLAGLPARRFFGFEFRSKSELFGLPLLHVAFGYNPYTGLPRLALGVVAVGNFAVGLIAIGGIAAGGFVLSGIGVGVLVLAGIAAGWVAVGGIAMGVAFALGGLAISSGLAVGGLTISSTSLLHAVRHLLES